MLTSDLKENKTFCVFKYFFKNEKKAARYSRYCIKIFHASLGGQT